MCPEEDRPLLTFPTRPKCDKDIFRILIKGQDRLFKVCVFLAYGE